MRRRMRGHLSRNGITRKPGRRTLIIDKAAAESSSVSSSSLHSSVTGSMRVQWSFAIVNKISVIRRGRMAFLLAVAKPLPSFGLFARSSSASTSLAYVGR